METTFNVFAKIDRVDETEHMVYGYVSTERLDNQGDIVLKSAMQDAWSDYETWGNIREMHQPKAAGVLKVHRHDDKGTWIGAHITDPVAWHKVVTKTYKGFSIGGKWLARKGATITKLFIGEISLADRPANPEAVITLFKIDKEPTMTDEEKAAADAAEAEGGSKVEKTETPADDNAIAKVEGAIAKADGAFAKVEGALAKVEAVEIRVDTALTKAEGRLAKAEGEVAKLSGELAKVSAQLAKFLDQPADDGTAVTKVEDGTRGTTDTAPEKPLEANDTMGHMAKALSSPQLIGVVRS